ncbi:hypothetical protein BX600DRAFT_507900 [Xylariales sp. PMI_506]|nr:hypothetical protein BX600DRAFT_507900 [Xylariales sp. PMI_506]
MSLPEPTVSLDGACSVIFNSTLYSYSSTAFQSLALKEGAEWNTLPSGTSVSGGVCVGSTPADASQAGLYIVGGTSSNSTYQGLQKYTYSTGQWESIQPQVAVTQSRLYHSATYLNGSDLLLIYAGSQDGVEAASTQTFTVGASAPYYVLAYESIAPPVIAPILLPWSDTAAVMVGGGDTNTQVMLFDPAQSWYNSGSTLAEPLLQDTSVVKAALITGDDGSKHMYTFDPTTSPTSVNRTVLAGAAGAGITNSAPIQDTASTRRRDLDVNDWPTYNATYAPGSTRTDYSLAIDDSSSMIVLSGGNTDDVLCMFSGRANSWVNATSLLVGDSFKIESTPTSSTTTQVFTPTSTPTGASATSTVAQSAAAPISTSMTPTEILGIALGVIFGCAFILVGLLFMLKKKRQRQAFVEAGHNRRASGMPEEKEYLPREMVKATGHFFPGHGQQDSTGSYSSVAILMGKVQQPGVMRKPSKDSKRSSVSSILNRQFKSTIGRPSPIPEPDMDPIVGAAAFEQPRARQITGTTVAAAVPTADAPKLRPNPPNTTEDGTRRSSGWNRYWSGGGMGSSRRETQASERSSQYTADLHRITQDSATVPPLHVDGFERPGFHRVNSGSPTVSFYSNHIKEGQSVEIERPISNASSSGYSSGIPPSVQEAYDPTSAKKPWGEDRAPNGAYSQTTYATPLGAPKTSRPPTGVSQQPQLALASHSSDMSWLNLGDYGSKDRGPRF